MLPPSLSSAQIDQTSFGDYRRQASEAKIQENRLCLLEQSRMIFQWISVEVLKLVQAVADRSIENASGRDPMILIVDPSCIVQVCSSIELLS